MDIAKIAELSTQIYDLGKFISSDDAEDIERLKELATALFAELDSDE